jgi:hypothetical protein
LLERAAADRRGHHEAEEHTDVDRARRRRDVRPDEERADGELGVGPGGDEDLPVRGGRDRDEHERREDRATIP